MPDIIYHPFAGCTATTATRISPIRSRQRDEFTFMLCAKHGLVALFPVPVFHLPRAPDLPQGIPFFRGRQQKNKKKCDTSSINIKSTPLSSPWANAVRPYARDDRMNEIHAFVFLLAQKWFGGRPALCAQTT
jgi:hypothetical protein